MASAAASAAAKYAATYAINKGKKAAYKIGAHLAKKGGKALIGAANHYLGGGGKEKKVPQGKAQMAMVKKGMLKAKGTQIGAYVPGSHAVNKKMAFASKAPSYAANKVMRRGRALSYGKVAGMKTRR
jgi:hypothetical protein